MNYTRLKYIYILYCYSFPLLLVFYSNGGRRYQPIYVTWMEANR